MPFAIPALVALLTLAPPNSSDPPAPPGGFAIRAWLAQPLTYADGYRTRVDVRVPDPGQVTPPATGWPGVLLVHALRSDRAALATQAAALAARGYLTVAYDVRGQGDTRGLNTTGGSTFVGPVEKADMAEVLTAVRGAHAGLLDFDRLAVVGFSQGALHARAAAAWSGRPLPQPRGAVARFPRLRAVHCDAALGTVDALFGRDGAVFEPLGLAPFLFPNGLRPDPAAAAEVRDLFVRQDFAGWAAWQQRPGRDDAAWLATSDVPVLCQTSWDDEWVAPNSVVDRLATLPATTPRAVLIETGDHGAPLNLIARVTRDERELRWLDHFLKGQPDELPREPTFHLGVTPDDPAEYADPLAVWSHRQLAAWPNAPGNVVTTLWPRTGGVLAATGPTGVEPADRVRHAVAPGFDPAAWLATANRTTAVLASVPLSQVAFRSAPLPADLELRGRPRVTLALTSAAPDLQVGVALFDEDARGAQRYLTGGFHAARGRAPGPTTVPVELGDCCTVVRAGHRLVLAFENHVWHRPPGQSRLRTVPYFASATFDVEHAAGRATRLELPSAPTPGFGCRAAIVRLSQAAGGAVLVALDGGPDCAGQPYATLVSLSGTLPGTALPGVTVPVNFDALTDLALLAAGTVHLPGFLGALDARGRAYAAMLVTPGLIPTPWVGAHLSFSAVTLGSTGLVAGPASQTRIVW